jgi:hypothetical protein
LIVFASQASEHDWLILGLIVFWTAGLVWEVWKVRSRRHA